MMFVIYEASTWSRSLFLSVPISSLPFHYITRYSTVAYSEAYTFRRNVHYCDPDIHHITAAIAIKFSQLLSAMCIIRFKIFEGKNYGLIIITLTVSAVGFLGRPTDIISYIIS